jgi:TolA-binding protein
MRLIWHAFKLIAAGVVLAQAGVSYSSDRPAPDPFLTGRAALEDGLYDVAEKQFLSKLQAVGAEWSSESEKVLEYYFRSLGAGHKWDDIITIAEKQAVGRITLPDMPMLTYWLARAKFETGKISEALEILLKRGNDEWTGELGWRVDRLRILCLVRVRRFEEALPLFAAFDKEYPASPERSAHLIEWAQVMQLAGKKSESADVLRRLVKEENGIDAQKAACLLAELYVSSTNLQGAMEVILPLARNEKAHRELRAEALLILAGINTLQFKTNEVISALTNAIAMAHEPVTRRRGSILLGQRYIDYGNLAEGAATLKKVIASAPGEPGAEALQMKIAESMLAGGSNLAAVEEFQYYLETYTNSAGRASAYYGRGLALFKLERYAEAATAFLRAHSLFPSSDRKQECLFKAADAFFANGQFQPAAEHYERILKEHPDSALVTQVLLQAGLAWMRAGDMARAEERLRGLSFGHSDSPYAPEAWLRLGEVIMLQGRNKEALEHFDALSAKCTNRAVCADALLFRGTIRYRAMELSEAVKDFQRVVKDFAETPAAERAAYDLAVCFYRLGEIKKAQAQCADFFDRYPGSPLIPSVVFWQAEMEYNRGNRPEAMNKFLGFADKYTNSPLVAEALLRAGMVTAEQKDYLKANDLFNRLARDYPSSRAFPEARFAQSDVLCQLGRFADAIVLLDEIINKFPASDLVIPAWGRKGDCHFSLAAEDAKRYAEAIKCFQVVVASPKSGFPAVIQAEYKIGRCLSKQSRGKEAVEHYYQKVMVPFLDAWSRGKTQEEAGIIWFTRAAFDAADLLEADKDYRRMVNILQRVVDTGLPAAKEAEARILKIKAESWWLFY